MDRSEKKETWGSKDSKCPALQQVATSGEVLILENKKQKINASGEVDGFPAQLFQLSDLPFNWLHFG